jgi:hypothetical protein
VPLRFPGVDEPQSAGGHGGAVAGHCRSPERRVRQLPLGAPYLLTRCCASSEDGVI